VPYFFNTYMRKTTFFWVFIFIQTLGFSASARGRIVLADSSKFQTISNLVYGNAPDHRNELDIYLPKKHGAKNTYGRIYSRGILVQRRKTPIA